MNNDVELKMIEKPEELVCKNHKKPPKYILKDQNLTQQERLVCEECMKNRDSSQPLTFDNIYDTIRKQKKERSEKTDQLLQESIKQLENVQEFIEKIQCQLESMKKATNKLIESLTNQRQQNFQFSFYEEVSIHLKEIDKSKEENDKINKIREEIINQFGKLRNQIASLPQNIDKISDKVINNIRRFYKKNYDEIHKTLEVNQINNITKQRDPCYTLTFNKTNDLLFTGCGNKIRVWKFDQRNISEITKLKGHLLTVTCIVKSNKVKNSFLSVGECGSLIIWKQKNEKEWESLKKQSQWTNSMILNKDETQLIQATANCQIDIWDVDFNQNQLTFKYSLDEYHTNTIFDISLNKKETRMVSCGADRKVIIWKKDNEDQQWTFQQEIIQITYGTKGFFLTDDIFFWIGCDQKTDDQIFFYEQKNGNFQMILGKNLQLEKDDQYIDFHLNPIIYNQQKDVFLLRFKRHIYIFGKTKDGERVIFTKLRFETNLIYATLSEDAKYIVTYIEDSKQYQIHEIKWN
ncbi:unnamed protein product [Paramecium pentaurelia]|uniref:WD40-repeat-containing domain n=1 Tax=Paramecium pentaurelia TaxID=43138 RepID=A0A8S1TKY5_9CILI|nr:unnamed protein product [Paramecium pentaurelia]